MKEYEPSAGFVSRVMKAVADWEMESEQAEARCGLLLKCRLPDSFRYVASSCGVLFGVFLAPATCL